MNINDILILLFVTYIMSIAIFIGALKNKKTWNWCLGFPIFYTCYFLVSLLQKRDAISKTLMASLFIIGLIAIALNLVAIIVAIANKIKNVEDAGTENPNAYGDRNSNNIASNCGYSIAGDELNLAVNNGSNVNSIPTSNVVTGTIENVQTMQNNAINSETNSMPTNFKFIKKGFKWFILSCMIATKDRNNNTKTINMDEYGNISVQDNSNRGSFVVRPCGKCSSVSGEKPLDFVFGFKPLKKEFVCCGVFSGFSFKNEDIVSYKLISSNSRNERYELQHINGKKIMLNCNAVGSELLNAVLGVEKLVNTN